MSKSFNNPDLSNVSGVVGSVHAFQIFKRCARIKIISPAKKTLNQNKYLRPKTTALLTNLKKFPWQNNYCRNGLLLSNVHCPTKKLRQSGPDGVAEGRHPEEGRQPNKWQLEFNINPLWTNTFFLKSYTDETLYNSAKWSKTVPLWNKDESSIGAVKKIK